MVKESYEINSSTCALIPNSNFTSTIIEKHTKVNSPSTVYEIINYSCAYYGSSFKGRLNGSKCALGSKYKLPIIVEESREMIFFPTSSYDSNDCIWISLNNIANYTRSENHVIVVFDNNQSIELKMSYESFENQVLRATKLLLILKSRKKDINV